MDENSKTIASYYENKEIFITGGSGFMGKFLIEKLLRSCPKVKMIYVLMRPKKDKSVEDRLKGFFDSQLFDKLKSTHPENLQKIKAISGDVLQLNLGISDEDIKQLENVTIIFHAAASVRFDDPIKDAIIMNTRGTYEMIKFAKKLKNITVFVHVSTAYCNPDKRHVEEKIYPPYMDWRDAIKIAENFDRDSLEPINEKLRCLLPNTYTFTKNLGENVIEEFKNEIPFVVYRPTIVAASLNDPLPGWIENFNGPVANLVASAIGLLRTNYSKGDSELDFIPADLATRAMMVAAYKKGNSKDPYNLDIYNCSMRKFQSITGTSILEVGKIIIKENPFERTIYAPGGTMTRCYPWHLIRYILFQISISFILDMIMKFTSKQKPILMKLQAKMILGFEAIKYFCETPYDFDNSNFFNLESCIPPKEYDDFTFLRDVPYDLEDFYRKNLVGAKIALLKEPPQATEAAKRRFKILVWVHRIYCTILIFLTGKYIAIPLFYVIKSKLFELLNHYFLLELNKTYPQNKNLFKRNITMNQGNIKNFYGSKEIFITGATGFMGKVLIEKLIRSCPKIKTIYILIRSKKGKSIYERLNEMLELPLFEKIRNENPDNLNKIIPINGDILETGLGISDEDMERLLNVSIIFHSAANVRFDEPLREAIIMNTKGTYEIIKFAKQLKNIEALVHVSTSYCYSDRFVIEEKLYPPYADWKNAITVAENYDNETLEIFNKKFSCYQPNTYIFTKNLAEHVIDSYKDDIPCAIYRPSIVISTVCDPIPGWIDNFNGPVGMLIASGVGIIRTMHADLNVASDYVPVDIAIKGLIIAAYKRGITQNSKELQIYNCSTGSLKTVTLEEVLEYGRCITEENPMERTLLYPSGGVTKCRYYNFIRFIVLQFFVAVIIDSIFKIINVKPFLMKLQRKIYSANCALLYFIQRTWIFKNENFVNLEKLVTNLEHEDFSFIRFKDIDTKEYFTSALSGAKKYLLKENENCSEAGRRRFKILKYCHHFVIFITCALLLRYILLPLLFGLLV
ncbi:uncharacterized protein LOC129611958 [Condylostylus longicornis]|uniref:uncharacterized protein LOC129611958 n=1 Tax=Condylostylus longicornis TaxID=2530218 RepID=UPI00244E378D|nr:uncharacterized protein LOC129611958 [Condylostylus longicornis]